MTPLTTSLGLTPSAPAGNLGSAPCTTGGGRLQVLKTGTPSNPTNLQSFEYNYDTVGNVNEIKDYKAAGGTQTQTFHYDNLDRLGDAVASGGSGGTYTLESYTYTSNKLSSITGDNLNITYQYDGLGERVSQTANSVTTHYSIDLNAGLSQVLSDGTNTYLYGVGRMAQESTSGELYFLADALGSVRQLVDANGSVQTAKSYEPYGDVLSSIGNGMSNYGFTGEWTDNYIELVNLRSRLYSPSTGRFLTKDPWQGNYYRPISYNPWIYGYDNPVLLIDPSGQWPLLGFKTQKTFKEPSGRRIVHEADTWTDAEMVAAENAARRIGRAFADVINSDFSLLRSAYRKDCDVAPYTDLPPISPVTAFYRVYKGPVIWEKRWTSPTNEATGQPCAEGTCTYAETQGRNLIYVMKNATNTYAVEHPQWIVHELGHAFEWATVIRNGSGNRIRPGQTKLGKDYRDLLVRISNDPQDPYAGFAGGFNEWQFSVETTPSPGEIFADMFIGWVYDAWMPFGGGLTDMAQRRKNFMDSTMPYLLGIALNK